MRRREFITLLGGAAATWPLAARAQQGERVRRVGALLTEAESDLEVQSWIRELVQRLQELGWTNGRNVQVDFRSHWPDQKPPQFCQHWARIP